MTAYYNEIDSYAAQWLRNLIAAGHIADGVVDERSIEDVKPNELQEFTQCHFFAGIGVWSLALRRSGWSDDRPIWTGSCPCQPFSAAGAGAGFADERHLWPAFFHLIEQCKPAIVFGEQVASKAGLEWLDLVSSDVESKGYAIAAANTNAASTGAAHIRQRLYWVANACGIRGKGQVAPGSLGKAGQRRAYSAMDLQQIISSPFSERGCDPKPLLCKGDDGFTTSVGRLRAYGNAIHADQAQVFIESVMECLP